MSYNVHLPMVVAMVKLQLLMTSATFRTKREVT